MPVAVWSTSSDRVQDATSVWEMQSLFAQEQQTGYRWEEQDFAKEWEGHLAMADLRYHDVYCLESQEGALNNWIPLDSCEYDVN